MTSFDDVLTEYMTVWKADYQTKLLPKTRKKVTCSICKETRHNKRRCTYACIYNTLDMMPKDIVNIIYDMKVSTEEYSKKCEYDRKQDAYKKDIDTAKKAYSDLMTDLFDVAETMEPDDVTVPLDILYRWDAETRGENMDRYAFNGFVDNYKVLCDKFSQKFTDDAYYVDKLKQLNNCKCCGFHMSHKPRHILDYDYVNEIRLRNEPVYVDECFCQCRHYSRNIVVLNKLRST